MLTIYLRSVFLYVFLLFLIRGMGKRQIQQLRPYELVFTIIVAELAASPMGDTHMPLLFGIMPIAALGTIYSLISILQLKSDAARRFFIGKPDILIHNGIVYENALRQQSLTLNDLMEQVREQGVESILDVGTAILETSGQITVFPRTETLPPTAKDLGVKTEKKDLPLTLLLDGNQEKENLKKAKVDEAWLRTQLKKKNLHEKAVFWCLLDDQGSLWMQPKGKEKIILIKNAQETEKESS